MFFFFNDTATTEIYTLSLHDALPIFGNVAKDLDGKAEACRAHEQREGRPLRRGEKTFTLDDVGEGLRSEEHTSELQSQSNLVCRLLLEKKKKKTSIRTNPIYPFTA